MCSTPVQRIAEIGRAIDDLAADARTAYRPAARKQRQPVPGDSSPGKPTSPRGAAEPAAGQAPSGPSADQCGAEPTPTVSPEAGASSASDADAASDAEQVLIRLAALWGKLAELDPEVAKRLPTYDA